jgi:hypothetical protein
VGEEVIGREESALLAVVFGKGVTHEEG